MSSGCFVNFAFYLLKKILKEMRYYNNIQYNVRMPFRPMEMALFIERLVFVLFQELSPSIR